MLNGVRASRPADKGGQAPLVEGGNGLRRLAGCVWTVLGGTAIYLAFNGLYVVTLAFTSNYGAGDSTVLSYAYLFASYLVAATGFALGMSRIADMSRGALAEWARDRRRHGAGRLSLLDAPGGPGARGPDCRWRLARRRGPAFEL